MTIRVTSATDVLLTLLYAKGSTGEYGEPIAGTTKLEKFMYLLFEESDLRDIINEEYEFVADNYGPCSHELFDDIEMLKDAGIIKEDKIRLVSQLDEGDTETSEVQSTDIDFTDKGIDNLRVFSLTEKGLKIAKIIYDSLTEVEKKKITILKLLYNKKPVYEIIRYVYRKYPEMTTESKIKRKMLKTY